MVCWDWGFTRVQLNTGRFWARFSAPNHSQAQGPLPPPASPSLLNSWAQVQENRVIQNLVARCLERRSLVIRRILQVPHTDHRDRGFRLHAGPCYVPPQVGAYVCVCE